MGWVKVPLARRHYPALASALGALLLAFAYLLYAASRPASPKTIDGKWVGTVTWNDASGRPYRQSFKTALFFLPNNVVGIVITFPTGAIGGAGTYTLRGKRLTITCKKLSVNGRPLPLTTFSHESWYHATAVYTVACDSEHLTLTPDKAPTPAPCWPLLVSPTPIKLSRIAPPETPADTAAPRE